MKTSPSSKTEGVLQKPIMTSVYTKYVHCEEKQNPGSSQQIQYGSNPVTYGVRRLGHGSRGGKNYLVLRPTPEHLAVGHEGWTEMRTRREHKRTAVN